MNLNSTPSSYFENEDRCPSCGDLCNIDDLDDGDYCNNCRCKDNISIILAMSENLTIGINNDLPWNLPSDLKMFKEITLNSIILMGRKCYDSIGRPLPKRENVILSSDTTLVIPGCVVVNSINEFMMKYKNDSRNIFIIGGATLYEQTFDIAHKLYITLVQGEVDGDVKVNGLDLTKWTLIHDGGIIIENNHSFKFMQFVRN